MLKKRLKAAKLPSPVYNAYRMPFEDGSFDIAHLRGVLHHMKNPVDALSEAFRIARTLVVIEPIGYNLVLKIIERFSRYHVEHQEKSYMPRTLDHWIDSLGGVLSNRQWFGLVPFFCPDLFAQAMKWLEPLVEGLPVFSTIAGGSYIFVATRANR